MPETDFPKPPENDSHQSHHAEIAAIAVLGIAGAGLAVYGVTRLWRARHAHQLQEEQATLATRIAKGASETVSDYVRIPPLITDNEDPEILSVSVTEFLKGMFHPPVEYTIEDLRLWPELREWQTSREMPFMEKPIIDSLGVTRYPLLGFEAPEGAILPVRGVIIVQRSSIHRTYGLVPMGCQTILQTEKSFQVSDRNLSLVVGKLAFVELGIETVMVDPDSPRDPWNGRMIKQRRYRPPPINYIRTKEAFGKFIGTEETP